MEKRQARLSAQARSVFLRQKIPGRVYFELTPRCTLDCRMCYVHLTPAQMGDRKELSTEQWLRIVDEAVEAGMLYAVLTGGECMLHPGFWEIAGHLMEKGVVVSVNTNAFAITDADFERFRQLRPNSFRVTLYGATEEGYERCTGHRALSRVLENVTRLRDAGFPIIFGVTLSRFNQDEFLEMVRIGQALKLRVHYSLDLREPNADTGRRLSEFALSQEEVIRLLTEFRRAGKLPFYRNDPITELPPRQPDDPSFKGLRCGGGSVTVAIHWDGRMSPCFECQSGFPVQELGFAAAWEKTKALAAEIPQPVECRSCRLFPACVDCVMLRRDPKNPGHANPERCAATVARWNAGLISLERPGPERPDFTEGKPDC